MLGAKGAQCRRAVPAVREALEEMQEELGLNTETHHWRLTVLQNLEELYDIVCRNGHYIAAPDAERLRCLAMNLLLHYCALTNDAIQQGR